jgi:hypothetical protein
MFNFLKTNKSLIIILLIYFTTILIFLLISLKLNSGHLIYALDDPYIHMKIAKNFISNGVWGINQNEFASASSSILWVFLLSVNYIIFGIKDSIPLILNILFGGLILIELYYILNKYIHNVNSKTLIILFILFAGPVPALVFSGLEHLLHTVLVIPFVYLLSLQLFNVPTRTGINFKLLLLGLLIPAARYEGLFLIFVAALLLFAKKQYYNSFLLIIVSVLPIFIFGIYSLSNGYFFIPNSVLLKGNSFGTSISQLLTFFLHPLNNAVRYPHLTLIWLANIYLLYLYFKKKSTLSFNEPLFMVLIFVFTTYFHMQFAKGGWFFRYEAYLVVLGLLTFLTSFFKDFPTAFHFNFNKLTFLRKLSVIIIILAVLISFGRRIGLSIYEPCIAMNNIYEQQNQMASFLGKFYNHSVVAVNDIGLVNYKNDLQCLDLAGLSSIEVAKLYRSNNFNPTTISQIASSQNARIAILHKDVFKAFGGFPKNWINVGSWTIRNNVICGNETVLFFALKEEEKEILINNLRAFSPFLPKNVIQSGLYQRN